MAAVKHVNSHSVSDRSVTGNVTRGAKLFNEYGPTEADSLTSTVYWVFRADSSGSVPIGRPIGNARMYVLDGEMRPVPVGVRGELYIGGAGVARGYLNRADLTAERFVPDPFHGRGERLYRSGDVGYWRWDGNLEYVGRADQQVKVRGYRIEPGEIEGVLREQAGVRDAVVLAREDTPGDKRLVGYVVGEEAPGGKELRRLLGERLPEYMVPGIYVHLASLPLTGNGKLDRSALPAPGSERDSGEEYVAPRNVLEELLCSIWSEVLKLDRVGVEDNFFELGGHSLLATQVVSQVRQVFGVELALREMFEWPTVGGLSVVLEQAQGVAGVSDQPALQRVREREHLPLSYAQQRLWFIEQLEGRSSTYNIPLSVRLLGELDAAALEHALTEVVRRHEVLRTRYVVGADGSSEQVIEPYREQHLERVSLAGLSAERVAELAAEEGSRAFDLAVGPMLRARLLELGEREHVLLLTMHHIASDGWSMGVLVRELGALYASYASGELSTLAELSVQYGDYAVWQREWLSGEVEQSQLSYWREQLRDLPVLELPVDYARPARPSHLGGTVSIELSSS